MIGRGVVFHVEPWPADGQYSYETNTECSSDYFHRIPG